MTHLLFYLILAVVVSFFCSLLEAVLLSVTPSFIGVAEKNGKKYGVILKELKSQIDRPLAAILTLNTVANTIGAAGVGAQVQNIYGNAYVAISSGLLTMVILIFSEIIPKTIGASKWKTLAPICAYPLRAMVLSLYPFVLLSEFLYSLLGGNRENTVTREEMIVTAEMGAVDGTLRQKESLVIKNLLMLDAIKVADIMTPRSVIHAFESDKTVQQIMTENRPIRFSRIPVYDEDLDHIKGMVHRYKILEASSHDLDNLKINELMTPIHSVPENISVAAALDQFIKRKEHIFVVVDDYGSTSGLVSLEDAVETLLGVEIVDEF
ncbi:MAG: HlyC/CorC family transporter, partial [Bdellovibrionales bacterium]|nr:HlyC/CorC family transporter [Bdellovibrionales bacterium]